jgi:spore coat protein A
MEPKSRRDFLKLCAVVAPALAMAKGDETQKTTRLAVTHHAFRTPGSIERYIDPLPIPNRLIPTATRGKTVEYRVRMLEFRQKMHSQLPPTRLWGYEGSYPGPTFEAERGRPVVVQWENHLPLRHMFEIDPHIHGAMPPAPAVRTVPHLHGSRTRSESDGLPEKWFTPGKSARYLYPNDQPAATLWYHDHAMGITRLNVYAGMSGFFLLRDEVEHSMALPSGDYEIPMILQDRTLDDKGQLVYSPTQEDGSTPPPGVWAPQFFGELPVVNGAIFPYLEVEPRCYRLRVLNGANSRFFNLFLNLAKRPTDIPAIVPFRQIGSDGGFLPRPAAMSQLLLGPAERADLLVDFSGLEDRTVTLSNNAAAPFPGWERETAPHAALAELMQFRVTRPLSSKASALSLPAAFRFARLDENAAIASRDFFLSERMNSNGQCLGVYINEKGYDDAVTEFVKLDSTEQWRFINTTDDAHTMHLHLVQFQIQHRQGFNIFAFRNGKHLELEGIPRVPEANELGWKDTAVVKPGEVLTILVRFGGYTGRYVFHCHMLEHEDNDMMRPYEVVSA